MAQKITVITPFSRKENKELLLSTLKGKCNWIVLQADDEPTIDFPDWVTVKRYSITDKTSISNRLINEFAFWDAEDDTQYMVLCDDDSVEEGFFEKIPNEDVVCVSMKRGDTPVLHAVWDDWKTKSHHVEFGIDTLVASPENMKVARVGGEQLIVKGKILKKFQYGLEDSTKDLPGDAKFVLDVIKYHTPVYVPDAYVLFNYFEDGRFKSFHRKPIVLFVGDYYCAGHPSMGLSEWEGNLWASLDALNIADVGRFHFDKYYYHTGQRADKVFMDRLKSINPDYVVMVVYKPLGINPTVPSYDLVEYIGEQYKLITIWGDLEAEEQRELAKQVAPHCWKVIGTANKKIVEEMGFTYMHVPKNPLIFNDPKIDRDIDVVFSGSYGYGRPDRVEVLEYVRNQGINLLVGGSEGGDHFTVEEYARRYQQAKIAISFSQARGVNVVNARPFEAMACGALLLEQKSPELAKLYDEGTDYDVWTTKEDLVDKIRYYLNNEDKRKHTAENGCRKTHEQYSAERFWKQVLER